MGKNKLQKFEEIKTFPHVFQLSFNQLRNGAKFDLKGRWNRDFFKNDNPIVIELGCGKGEYTVELARRFPNRNFIGIDIKGARIWSGAKESYEAHLNNVAFLRTSIDSLTSFFDIAEVDEIWLTFPDPQMKKFRKRLTSSVFLSYYAKVLKPEGLINLKTDSNFLYSYTSAIAECNNYEILHSTDNLYAQSMPTDSILSIKTYYEQQWLSRGISIKYLCFKLKPFVEIIEPKVEIEPDSYRSFGRSRRV